jgi:hypothetical protein
MIFPKRPGSTDHTLVLLRVIFKNTRDLHPIPSEEICPCCCFFSVIAGFGRSKVALVVVLLAARAQSGILDDRAIEDCLSNLRISKATNRFPIARPQRLTKLQYIQVMSYGTPKSSCQLDPSLMTLAGSRTRGCNLWIMEERAAHRVVAFAWRSLSTTCTCCVQFSDQCHLAHLVD